MPLKWSIKWTIEKQKHSINEEKFEFEIWLKWNVFLFYQELLFRSYLKYIQKISTQQFTSWTSYLIRFVVWIWTVNICMSPRMKGFLNQKFKLPLPLVLGLVRRTFRKTSCEIHQINGHRTTMSVQSKSVTQRIGIIKFGQTSLCCKSCDISNECCW